MKRVIGAATAAVALMCASAASAAVTTLTFEDIPATGSQIDQYGGLRWNNFVSYSVDWTIPISGYYYAAVPPGKMFAVNGRGADAELFTPGGSFDFLGGVFTGAFREGLELTITGFRGLDEAYSETITLSVSGRTSAIFDWQDVTRLTFSATGGTPLPSASGTHFGMDNLSFDFGGVSAVPEPATWAMMIIGFGAVGSMVRKARPVSILRRRGRPVLPPCCDRLAAAFL